MAVTFVGAAAAESPTVTIPTHTAGDLMVMLALSWTVGSLPTPPYGWTTATTSTSEFPVLVAYRAATSTSDTSGTWTGADLLSVAVWGGVDTLGGAAAATIDTDWTTGAGLPGITMTEAGTAWVGAMVGASTAVSGGTLRASATDEWYVYDSAAAVSSWATQTGDFGEFAAAFELIPASGGGETPTATATAAETFGWGTPVSGDEFDDPTILTGEDSDWYIFEGPGYQGNGTQSAAQVSVADSILKITGLTDGTTGALGWYGDNRQYGRWEARVRANHPDTNGLYHPVLLLWPASEDWPGGGEIDWFEGSSGAGGEHRFALIWEDALGDPASATGEYFDYGDGWHHYAVEWTPTAIIGYTDGVESFRDEDTSHFPPGPMWLGVQLDWVPWTSDPNTDPTVMEVDWIRVYDLSSETVIPAPTATVVEPEQVKVEVFDRGFGFLGVVNGPSALECTWRLNAASTATISVPAASPKAWLLMGEGNRVRITVRGMVWSGTISRWELDGLTAGSTVTATWRADIGWLEQLLLWQSTGTITGTSTLSGRERRVRTGTAETVLKSFMGEVVTRLSLPVTIATDQARGSSITVSARMDTPADLILPLMEDAGLRVTLLHLPGTSTLTLDVEATTIYGRTLTAASGVLGTDTKVSEDAAEATRCVIGGAGDGVSQVYRQAVNSGAAAVWPPREIYVDASSLKLDAADTAMDTQAKVDAAMDAAGWAALADKNSALSVVATLSETRHFRMADGVLEVGDRVPLSIAIPGTDPLHPVTLDMTETITEATATWTTDKGLLVVPRLGDWARVPSRAWLKRIKDQSRAIRALRTQ